MKRWWEKIAIFYFNKNEIDASKIVVAFYSDEVEVFWSGILVVGLEELSVYSGQYSISEVNDSQLKMILKSLLVRGEQRILYSKSEQCAAVKYRLSRNGFSGFFCRVLRICIEWTNNSMKRIKIKKTLWMKRIASLAKTNRSVISAPSTVKFHWFWIIDFNCCQNDFIYCSPYSGFKFLLQINIIKNSIKNATQSIWHLSNQILWFTNKIC